MIAKRVPSFPHKDQAPRIPLWGWLLLLWAGLAVVAPAAAAAAEHPILAKMGLAAADLPAPLYLVRSPRVLTSGPGIEVHGSLRDSYLVSGEQAVVQSLTGRGCFVLELPDAVPETGERIRIPVSCSEKAADPRIQALVDELTWESLSGKIQWLVDFGTRYTFDPICAQAAEDLRVYFADLGLAVEKLPFDVLGTTGYNIVATQVGSKYPDQFYVICGHYDSISQNETLPAPGADDNATGAAAVMSAAEILSSHTFDYSIKYICFGAEEQGLVGSKYYVPTAVNAGVDFVGALNFDMLGYWESTIEDDLEIETNAASLDLAAVVVAAAELYTDAVYELHQDEDAWWGDHYRFWLNGVPAINHEEAWDWGDLDFNPHYHTHNDLLQFLGPDFTLRNVKVGLASLAVLAHLDEPVDVPTGPARAVDLRLTAYPNPFNGNVRIDVQCGTGSERLDLDIYDLRGRLIASLPVQLQEGRGEADWPALDRAGHPCEAGVYMCRARQANPDAVVRFSYVK